MPDVYLRRRTGRHASTYEFSICVAGRDRWLASWQAMYRADPCVYCYGPCETYDHIRPRSANGSSQWTNLAPACATCNVKKGARPLLLFLMDLPGVSGRHAARRNARNSRRALVRHLLHPERCARPLRYPMADKLIAAFRARSR